MLNFIKNIFSSSKWLKSEEIFVERWVRANSENNLYFKLLKPLKLSSHLLWCLEKSFLDLFLSKFSYSEIQVFITEKREYLIVPYLDIFAICGFSPKELQIVFGKMFWSVIDPTWTFNPLWRSDTVVSLAQTMYETNDFSAMPILADALEDADCTEQILLQRMRSSDAQWVCGCRIIDEILQKRP